METASSYLRGTAPLTETKIRRDASCVHEREFFGGSGKEGREKRGEIFFLFFFNARARLKLF